MYGSGVLIVLFWVLHGWCHVKCCRFGASSVYTIQSCTRLQCHFIQSHVGRMYVCSAVTCHMHFWQNDRNLLHATAVTWGWNGYQNKSQHRKLTLKKKILPPRLPRLEPGTFQSQVQRSKMMIKVFWLDLRSLHMVHLHGDTLSWKSQWHTYMGTHWAGSWCVCHLEKMHARNHTGF